MKVQVEMEGDLQLSAVDKPIDQIHPRDYVLYDGRIRRVSARSHSLYPCTDETGAWYNWRFTFTDSDKMGGAIWRDCDPMPTMTVIEAVVVND